jgi:hypothetical protein
MDILIFEQSRAYFDNSRKTFLALEKSIEKFSNGFWGTSILVEQTPFDFERSQIKRGKKLSKPPKNKGNKFFHIQNEHGVVVAIFGYIDCYEYPSTYVYVQRDKETERFYTFDIEKKLLFFQHNEYTDSTLSKSVKIQKNGDYIIELYHYDNINRLVEIERKHKDKSMFRDVSFFPDNIYSTKFVLEYTAEETQPLSILWNANNREPKQVWAKK